MHRRHFAKQGLLSMGFLWMHPQSLFKKSKIIGANDRIQVGLIGAKGMGWSNLFAMLHDENVFCTAICDVDDQILNSRIEGYKDFRDNEPTVYKDYRNLLNDENVDIVIIGTPDHWHCKMFADAVSASKHVYLEKPIGNTIEECLIMSEIEKSNDTIVQVGQWQRSGEHYKNAIDIVQKGDLGKIRLVKSWAYQGWMKSLDQHPNTVEPPKGVDYNMWLGPAPKRPFNQNRFHFNFRWFWDYAGGLMTDWGVHQFDIVLEAMQAKGPKTVFAKGGKIAYPSDPAETPDTLQAFYTYEGFNLIWEHAAGINNGPYSSPEGISFIGENGTLLVNRQGYEVFTETETLGFSGEGEPKMQPIEAFIKPNDKNYIVDNTANFLEAVRANDKSILNAPLEVGARAAIHTQMGNISYKVKSELNWNDKKSAFLNNEKANKLLSPIYFNNWEIPKTP